MNESPPTESGSSGAAFIDARSMSDERSLPDAQPWRESITRGFTRVEDAVYVGLGTLLGAIAVGLLVTVAVAVVQASRSACTGPASARRS